MRFKDPLLCPVGALGLYLFYRFYFSGEMEGMDRPDFTNNSSWFNIRLYTNGKIGNREKGVGSGVYGESISRVMKVMNVHSKHTAHLGRVLGPKFLEMNQFTQDDIRILGNWQPTTQESTYSTQLPMAPMRCIAGFKEGNGMHYNPRTQVVVPEELSSAVFPWLEEALSTLEAFEFRTSSTRPTAKEFLNLCKQLSDVVIQDVAVMKLLYNDRCQHSLLMAHGLFQTDAFLLFMEEMKKALRDGEANDPTKATVESVLPGVHQQFANLNHEMNRMRVSLEALKELSSSEGVTGMFCWGCFFLNE